MTSSFHSLQVRELIECETTGQNPQPPAEGLARILKGHFALDLVPQCTRLGRWCDVLGGLNWSQRGVQKRLGLISGLVPLESTNLIQVFERLRNRGPSPGRVAANGYVKTCYVVVNRPVLIHFTPDSAFS